MIVEDHSNDSSHDKNALSDGPLINSDIQTVQLISLQRSVRGVDARRVQEKLEAAKT